MQRYPFLISFCSVVGAAAARSLPSGRLLLSYSCVAKSTHVAVVCGVRCACMFVVLVLCMFMFVVLVYVHVCWGRGCCNRTRNSECLQETLQDTCCWQLQDRLLEECYLCSCRGCSHLLVTPACTGSIVLPLGCLLLGGTHPVPHFGDNHSSGATSPLTAELIGTRHHARISEILSWMCEYRT